MSSFPFHSHHKYKSQWQIKEVILTVKKLNNKKKQSQDKESGWFWKLRIWGRLMDERYYYLYETIIICVDVNEGILFQFYIFFHS